VEAVRVLVVAVAAVPAGGDSQAMVQEASQQ